MKLFPYEILKKVDMKAKFHMHVMMYVTGWQHTADKI